jgi:nicotinamide riboside kinase
MNSLKNFTLEMFEKNPSILIIGQKNSGKSFLCKELINYFKQFSTGTIISDSNEFYSKFFSDTKIYHDYSSIIIEEQLKNKEEQLKNKTFIVMDDCFTSNNNLAKDENIKQLLFNGRHMGITYILTMQFPLSITPEIRNNFDYVFLLANDLQSDQEKIWKHYANIFPTFDAFHNVYRDLTNNFGCMVLVNRDAKEGFNKKVFSYKASN